MATGRLVEGLILFSPLRAEYEYVPSQADMTQRVVLAVVAWVIAGTLGGLHYWLIRRDLRHDPEAGNSAIRSFFLNITEAIGFLIAIDLIGFQVISSLGHYGVAWSASFALSLLGMVVWLEFERRRTSVHTGAAVVFQRIHLYGVQLVLLISLISAWFWTIRLLVDGLIFNVSACSWDIRDVCRGQLWNYAGVALWFVVTWAGYSWFTRTDRSRVSRFLMHGIGLMVGVGYGLASLYYIVQLLLLPLVGQGVALQEALTGYDAPYDFVTPLALGLLISGGYYLLLRYAVKQGIIERGVLRFTVLAIVATLSGFLFWWGWGQLLFGLLQTVGGSAPDVKDWIAGLSMVIVGLGYIPLEFFLRRQGQLVSEVARGPRRGMAFALLGSGTLALASGGIATLYGWLTAVLGTPMDGWEQLVRGGIATFLIGGLVAGFYFWNSSRELLLERKGEDQTPVSAPENMTIERVLDNVLAGKITRNEAVTRLQGLYNAAGNNPGH
jgi:hypothetical protein